MDRHPTTAPQAHHSGRRLAVTLDVSIDQGARRNNWQVEAPTQSHDWHVANNQCMITRLSPGHSLSCKKEAGTQATLPSRRHKLANKTAPHTQPAAAPAHSCWAGAVAHPGSCGAPVAGALPSGAALPASCCGCGPAAAGGCGAAAAGPAAGVGCGSTGGRLLIWMRMPALSSFSSLLTMCLPKVEVFSIS